MKHLELIASLISQGRAHAAAMNSVLQDLTDTLKVEADGATAQALFDLMVFGDGNAENIVVLAAQEQHGTAN